eukprot:763103-Hanusia_phi.AAC.2
MNGHPGMNGADGSVGPPGPNGVQGLSGTTGVAGEQGLPGPQGTQKLQGPAEPLRHQVNEDRRETSERQASPGRPVLTAYWAPVRELPRPACPDPKLQLRSPTDGDQVATSALAEVTRGRGWWTAISAPAGSRLTTTE